MKTKSNNVWQPFICEYMLLICNRTLFNYDSLQKKRKQKKNSTSLKKLIIMYIKWEHYVKW